MFFYQILAKLIEGTYYILLIKNKANAKTNIRVFL
jgi:hypothetical protein